MITMKIGILTFDGTTFLMLDTKIAEHMRTNEAAKLMPIALSRLVVPDRERPIPKTLDMS